MLIIIVEIIIIRTVYSVDREIEGQASNIHDSVTVYYLNLKTSNLIQQ